MLAMVLAFWQTAQAPSPMVEHTRAHGRLQKTELRGERIATRFGSILLPEGARAGRATPLVVHFHGAAWVAEQGVRRAMRRAAVIGVELGSGSKVYGDGFAEAAALEEILRAFGREARPLYLTAFSAGYGAVRAILRRPELERRVDGVVLLDAIHSGYEEPEKERRVEAGPLAEFEAYARRAMEGRSARAFQTAAAVSVVASGQNLTCASRKCQIELTTSSKS